MVDRGVPVGTRVLARRAYRAIAACLAVACGRPLSEAMAQALAQPACGGHHGIARQQSACQPVDRAAPQGLANGGRSYGGRHRDSYADLGLQVVIHLHTNPPYSPGLKITEPYQNAAGIWGQTGRAPRGELLRFR
jgi:hypothetical protein